MKLGEIKGSNEHAGWIEIGDVGRKTFGQQNQYFARYYEMPDLVKGLRVYNKNPDNYHGWLIHPEDKDEFIKRIKKYRTDKGLDPTSA